MKKLEDAIRSIRKCYYRRLGFTYDHAKRMWFKSYSDCCHTSFTQYVAGYDKKTKKPSMFRWRCNNCNKACKPITETKV